MRTPILILLSAVFLSSCAYFTEKQIQELTILTPGAKNALCNVYIDKVKFVFHPPETRTVPKSDQDLIVDCTAPGNRKKKVIYAPVISRSTLYNVGNAVVPGVFVDHTSKAMYDYPDRIEVDFTNIDTKPFPLPAQNQPDIKQPEEYDLEEFRPGQPRLNEDRYAPEIEIRKRQPMNYESFLRAQGGASGGASGEAQAAEAGQGQASQSDDNPVDRVIGEIKQGIEVPAPPSQDAPPAVQPVAPSTDSGGEPGASSDAVGAADPGPPDSAGDPVPLIEE